MYVSASARTPVYVCMHLWMCVCVCVCECGCAVCMQERYRASSAGDSAASAPRWFEFNDSRVGEICPTQLPNLCFGGKTTRSVWSDVSKVSVPMATDRMDNAYLLFYERVEQPIAPPQTVAPVSSADDTTSTAFSSSPSSAPAPVTTVDDLNDARVDKAQAATPVPATTASADTAAATALAPLVTVATSTASLLPPLIIPAPIFSTVWQESMQLLYNQRLFDPEFAAFMISLSRLPITPLGFSIAVPSPTSAFAPALMNAPTCELSAALTFPAPEELSKNFMDKWRNPPVTEYRPLDLPYVSQCMADLLPRALPDEELALLPPDELNAWTLKVITRYILEVYCRASNNVHFQASILWCIHYYQSNVPAACWLLDALAQDSNLLQSLLLECSSQHVREMVVKLLSVACTTVAVAETQQFEDFLNWHDDGPDNKQVYECVLSRFVEALDYFLPVTVNESWRTSAQFFGLLRHIAELGPVRLVCEA
jgi:hypothetical protein